MNSFRNLSNSKIGMAIVGIIGALIVFSFAMGDITNLGGTVGGNSAALAEAGDEAITDRDVSQALEQELARMRQQNPEAQYADLDGVFEPLLDSLITERAIDAFAKDNGFILSKRLVDAEIARIPGVTGPDGKFSDNAYRAFLSQRRLTDAQIRQAFTTSLYQRLLMLPVSAEVRVPTGIARPYASMLLEKRTAEVTMIPARLLRDGIAPKDADLERFYRAQSARYMLPEQRVLRIAPITDESVTVAEPTAAEVSKMLAARADEFGAKESRVISQVVLSDEATAKKVAAAARAGSFVDAVKPEGYSAADVSVGPQTREQFAALATEDVAAAVFADSVGGGTVVGPVRSSFGWHVVRVESVASEGGVAPDVARATVLADLKEAKRKAALVDMVTKVEDLIQDGASFAEAAEEAGLKVVATPAITAAGRDLDAPDYRFPPELAGALRNGFQLFADDDPEVATLDNDAGFALVAVGDIIEAAPAPLADIRAQVREDFIAREALNRARSLATEIRTAIEKGATSEAALAAAREKSGLALPELRRLTMRRIDLAQLRGDVPAPVQMMFNLAKGQSQLTGGAEGDGIYVVKVTDIERGDATTQPSLVTRTANDFRQLVGDELGEQFLKAIRKDVGVKRNDKAIAATRRRIIGGDQ